MGFYNPITYFIKSFIRLFTRKFFWVILILICVFLGFVIFSTDNVFAESNYSLNTDYFTDADVTYAHNILGDTIWNDPKYDIILRVQPGYGAGNNGKVVVFIDVSNFDSSFSYKINTSSKSTFSGDDHGTPFSYYYYDFGLINNSNDSFVTPKRGWSTINRFEQLSNLNIVDSSSSYSNAFSSQLINLGYQCSSTSNEYSIYCKPIRTHFDILDSNNNVLYNATNPFVVPPYFITTQTELEQFDFDYLQINGGTTLNSYYYEPLDVVYNADYLLQYRYKGVVTEIDVRPYLTVNSDETWQINIPYNVLTNYVVVRNGEDFSYRFRYTLQYETGYDMLKGGTYNLTSQQEQDINEDSDKYVQGEILDQQKETNQKLDDLNNNITNDDVDDVSSEFGDFANDFGAEDNTGIEQIFQKLYDAFCEDSIQDVVITIPFVNKTFTISTDTISSNFPQAIKSIVGVFVWGVIGLWVLKDIRSSINKIAEGSPEDVGSDVKKEVL